MPIKRAAAAAAQLHVDTPPSLRMSLLTASTKLTHRTEQPKITQITAQMRSVRPDFFFESFRKQSGGRM